MRSREIETGLGRGTENEDKGEGEMVGTLKALNGPDMGIRMDDK